MKRSIDETAERFDGMSDEYDETRSDDAVQTAETVVRRGLDSVDEEGTVVDIGTGTGAVALEIAPYVGRVYALDISEGMLREARDKAEELGIENVEFGHGTFREPNQDFDLNGEADVVVSNFAMHHLNDDEKEEALGEVRRLLGDEGVFVLGDVIIFDDDEVSAEYYEPEVDDPATVERLVEIFERHGFDTRTERIGPMAGVVEGELSNEGGTTQENGGE